MHAIGNVKTTDYTKWSAQTMSEYEITYVLVSLVSFGLGVVCGWLVAKEFDLSGNDMRRFISLVLILLYVVSVISEIQVAGYQTPVVLHGIIGALVGYLFSKGADKPLNINIKP